MNTTIKRWPYITFEEKWNRWRVDARTAKGGSRRVFQSKLEAQAWADKQRILREEQGDGVFDDSELKVFGLTIRDAIRMTLERCRAQNKSLPIEDVITRLIETKRAAKRSESYLALVQINLRKAAQYFAGRQIAGITTDELNTFLASMLIAPDTWNTIRRDLCTLWNFAIKLGVARENVAERTERAKAMDAPPGIFTPEQISALLTHASGDLLAYYAIGAFAGLRTCEIKRLDWKEVNLSRDSIEVVAKKAKTGSRRLVPILPNLKAWLQPIAKASGPVCGPNLRRRYEALREVAGIKEWPDNGLRHSFCSYALAATHNAAQVALDAGHSPEILFKHYRELVHPEDAERYFNILPTPADNIINIAA